MASKTVIRPIKLKYEIGKEAFQYRGPVRLDYQPLFGKKLHPREQWKSSLGSGHLIALLSFNLSFKDVLRRFPKDINNFSFKAPTMANKDDNYIYF